MRGAVDQRLIFERLHNADKGIYQQRVAIDDYANISGVSKKLYKQNGLPETIIPASDFGVFEAGYDLPARNAITFAERATLTELKPGEKIYRVTNDPSVDPYAKTGGYWTHTPPAQLAEVIGGTAVMPEWNNFQRVYEFTVPPDDPANSLPKV
ncbi:MAG: hypothetical protein EOO63_07925 [Hymenobacter sp.]|nr:MAG: hypothetical protein EOO63_07925 [Hymenobacter sp.]